MVSNYLDKSNRLFWRRQWHPTLVFLPGKSHGPRSMVRLQSMGSQRVGHDFTFTFVHWRRKWQPTPVFLPRESQGRGAWWAAVYGVTQSCTRLTWLSSSSSNRLFIVMVLYSKFTFYLCTVELILFDEQFYEFRYMYAVILINTTTIKIKTSQIPSWCSLCSLHLPWNQLLEMTDLLFLTYILPFPKMSHKWINNICKLLDYPLSFRMILLRFINVAPSISSSQTELYWWALHSVLQFVYSFIKNFFTKYISDSNIKLFLGLKTKIWKYLGHTAYKVVYFVFIII